MDATGPSRVSVALACPGQGVDPRDVARVFERHREHRLVLALAGITERRRWDDADLADTRLAQPAIVCASIVAGSLRRPDACATIGHSLGELAAAALAGAFTAEEALELAVERARLGAACHEQRPGRMLVVMRLDEAGVERLRADAIADCGGALDLAVVNGTGQLVLSGDARTAEHAIGLAAARGAVARPLPIGGAYHSELVADAVEPFRRALAAVCRRPEAPVVSCTTAQALVTAESVVDGLAGSLVLPVRWPRAVAAALATGADHLVDVGPGRTLANLANHDPALATLAADDE